MSHGAKAYETFDEAVLCLANNIYFEARSEPVEGQIAVAIVTINRARDERFPDTICGVVEQAKTDDHGIPLRNQCQFSWYCDGKPDDILNIPVYEKIYKLAIDILLDFDNIEDITKGATHYHTTYVNPFWKSTKKRTVRISTHIFYRW
jgi:spore germination cell wall hydrolase CwlJ-like protein